MIVPGTASGQVRVFGLAGAAAALHRFIRAARIARHRAAPVGGLLEDQALEGVFEAHAASK
jgi:hypothetical protein